MCRAAVAPGTGRHAALDESSAVEHSGADPECEACRDGREGAAPGHPSSWFELDHTRLALLAFGAVEAIAFAVYPGWESMTELRRVAAADCGRRRRSGRGTPEPPRAIACSPLTSVSPPARDPCLT
jgi:hypothetical protein